ncbi:glycosyltransferase [Allochromatium palmeri]|nr:glycosyltransferase [Allochromatium palmeri]
MTPSNEKKKSCLFVIGMHRTGTSAVAELLQEHGFDFGQDLLAANAWNPHGYFESQAVIRLNDALLASGAAHWHTLFHDLPATGALIERARPDVQTLVSQVFGTADAIAIKDPRLCQLLPVWRTLLQEAGYRVGYLVMVRDPLACADSLARRDGFAPLKSLWLWGLHLFEALGAIDPAKSILVHYEDLITAPDQESGRLIAWLRSQGWIDDIQVDLKSSAVIDPSLSRAGDLDARIPEAHHDRPAFVTELYRELCAPDGLARLSEYLPKIARQLALDRSQDLPRLLALVEHDADRLRVGLEQRGQEIETARHTIDDLVEQLAAARESHQHLNQELESARQQVVALSESIPARLRFFLETPRHGLGFAGSIRLSGWCLHPQYEIESLQLEVDGCTLPCEYGHARPDVHDVHAHIEHGLNSGFCANARLKPGRYRLRVSAALTNGRTESVESMRILRILPDLGVKSSLMPNLHRVASFLGFALSAARTWYRNHRRLPHPAELPQLIRLALNVHAQQRSSAQDLAPPAGFSLPSTVDPYLAWIQVNRLTEADRAGYQRAMSEFTEHADSHWPRLSVVMPVYDPPRELFEAAVDSVRTQIYPHWELCIADDASPQPWVRERLLELAADDPRIRVVLRPTNGHISRCTNSATELASGSHLCLLDQDDLLAPEALMEVALALLDQPDTDLLYSDDDKIDVEGRRYDPQFKPDWSPELLLSYMYFSHLFVIRRELFASLGGLRVGFEGAQDYDLALRASEQARAVRHIPRILYHWRALPGSTATSGNAKPASFDAGERALNEAFSRRGVTAEAYRPLWAKRGGLGIYWHRFPDDGPSVAVLIPSRNNWRILKRCIDSLARTSYRNYQILIIDNASDDPETQRYLAELDQRVISIPNGPEGFSFAAINNRAVHQVTSDYVLFLNDDTEVIAPYWLSQMLGYARLEGVGAVGARLLFPNETLQHAGVVHGYYDGLAGPAFKGQPRWHHGYLSYAMVGRNYSAVTAACLLTPRVLFEQLGGFDESQFAVAYNDVDYGYRLIAAGYRCVYAPGAELYHHEGYSRGLGLDDPAEVLNFRARYRDYRDPYYNPHLSFDDEGFQIASRRLPRGSLRRPIRALMCAFTLNHEGAPYSQYELTCALKDAGILDPIVYSPYEGPLRALYEQAGIQVRVAPHPLLGVFDLQAYEAAIDRFAELADSLGVDLIYANTLQTFYAIAAARRLGKPCLWNVRESEPWQTYFDFLAPPIAVKALECFTDPYRIIFVAETTRHQFEPLNSRNNFSVIHNGLNMTRFQGVLQEGSRQEARRQLEVSDQDFVVLLLGTVCERKGQLDLVQACAHLPPESGSRLRVFIVGDRPSDYSLRLHRAREALAPALRERIHIVSEVGQPAVYYAAADCFVCTSRIESYPRVILEAMAFELPIISAPTYGVVEQVREGINADFYPAGQPSVLAERLQALMHEPERLARYRRNAPLVLRSLTQFDEMVAAYARLFVEAAELSEK